MRFRMLGPLEVWSEEGWMAISAPKWRSLLACLLLRPGQIVSTDSLILELWEDSPPAKANNLVSIYVHRLRRLIGDTEGRTLVHRAPGYLLRIGPDDLDTQEFESLVARGRDALAAADPASAAALLAEALGLWRGPLLADVSPSGLITREAERAEELRLAASELRIEADLECGRAAQVIPELRRLVAENRIREGLWLLLMRALDRAGRHAEALETYTQARQAISEELGVDPGAELQQLYAELLAADASSASSSPPRTRSRRREPAVQADRSAEEPVQTGAPGTAPGQTEAAADETDADIPLGEVPGTISIGTFAELAPAPAAAASAPSMAVGAPVPRPSQLPADIGDFTGREVHVRHLCEMLVQEESASSPGAVRIAVVAGAAGLGKTTLAVHAAHQVSAVFSDGQLYVDLSGASSQPLAPGEVLARFLRDLGVEGDKVPAGDDERGALYRTRLTGRRVLIVLDNARDAAQVRPLLPGSASCAVLVTTRRRPTDLASTRFVDLNVLEDDEALALFSRVVGDERPAAEPDATAEVLLACAGLPLAIRICAARLAARRHWKIATMANRLRDEHRRLDEMKTGDLAVRASFQVSYDSLQTAGYGADPARAFRLLGLGQGSSISLPAAGALLGEPEGDVADALETLVDANLLESPAPDWYRFHDLLRFYATERAQEAESEADRAEAISRLLRWYVRTADVAAQVVAPHRYRVALDEDREISPLALASVEGALDWYESERDNVMAATRQAATAGLHDLAWQLPTALFPIFNRRDNWADCITSHRVAASSAHIAGHPLGEAWALHNLGQALARVRDKDALGHLEQALVIRREMQDSIGEAQTALSLADAYHKLQGPQTALEHMMRHLDLMREYPSLYGLALNNLGEYCQELGRLEEAADYFEQARAHFASVGPAYGQGYALHNLSHLYLDLSRPADALECARRALDIHKSAGDLLGQGLGHKFLGEAQLALGQPSAARESWTAALATFTRLGEDAEAVEMRAALASLASQAKKLSPWA
jgi:DNA-binding SARP family transcriptional activator/Tfp pilus assembly protein PilF